MPVIPDPDVNINDVRPEGEDPQAQTDWANSALHNADSNKIESGGSVEATQANLQTVATGVAAKEEATLITNELDHLNSGDASYGQEMCNALETLDNSVSNLNDLNSVVQNLQSQAQNSGTQAPDDLANVINDAATQFEQAFGQCINDLSSTQWIIQVLQDLFCPS